MDNKKEYINPDGLFKSPAFSQIVTTQGSGKTIYVGGQNAVDKNVELVGKNDIAAQTEQAMKNLETALKSCGADFKDLVKLNIYLLQGQDLKKGFEVSQNFLKEVEKPPVVTVLFVAGFVNPDYLIEIDATAFICEI